LVTFCSLIHRASDDVVDWDEQSHGRFIREINDELVHHSDKEIMVYVQGTKTGFEPAIAMAREIDHFAGKDSVGVAFAWPAHRNILHYLLGIDVRRAQHSSEALRDLIKLLASETEATRINFLGWRPCCFEGPARAPPQSSRTRSPYAEKMLPARFGGSRRRRCRAR
jgi:hypothetical protein